MTFAYRLSAMSESTPTAVPGEEYRKAMSRAATGVNVVTTNGVGGSVGLTVSAMCSLSLDPPSLLVCIYQDSPARFAIEQNRCFAVNVLAQDQQEIALCFAGQVRELRDDRFAIAKWYPLLTGSWGLPEAVAIFDCLVDRQYEYGTHCIFIGTVQECRVRDTAPAVHVRGAFTGPMPINQE